VYQCQQKNSLDNSFQPMLKVQDHDVRKINQSIDETFLYLVNARITYGLAIRPMQSPQRRGFLRKLYFQSMTDVTGCYERPFLSCYKTHPMLRDPLAWIIWIIPFCSSFLSVGLFLVELARHEWCRARFCIDRSVSGTIEVAMLKFLSKARSPMTFLLAVRLAMVHPTLAQPAPSANLKQADADYRAGVAALSHNDLHAALADFQSVVRLAPSAEQGHSALGAVLVRLGQVTAGIRELEKALAMQPGDSSAQLNLALAYEQTGEPAKSLPLFAKLEAASHVSRRPLDVTTLASYARALAAAGQPKAAISRMKEAVIRDPHNAAMENDLGSLYAQLEDWPDAKAALSAAIAARPDFALAHLRLGLTLQALQQPGAVDELKTAWQLAPGDPSAALELGKALAGAGKDEEALPVLQKAAELDAASTSAAYQLGLVLERLQRLDEAIPLLQRAADANPNNAEALTNLGLALCLAQRAKDAVPLLQRAVTLEPDNVIAHQNLAVADIQLSQLDDAIVQLRAALKLSPSASQLHYNLGYALKMQDDAAGAIPELEAAEKLNPAAPEPPYLLGVLYMQAARYADAERELSASLKLRPENGDGWATMGSVENKLDKLPEAVAALKEAIRQSPLQADPHLTLAAVLVKQNQPAEAADERKEAAALMREHMNLQRAQVSTHSADSLLISGKVDEAIADYRDAISYDASYAEAYAGLAKALERQGKTMEAAAELKKATSLRESAPQ
jgi:protein O-GlcNAc transferase